MWLLTAVGLTLPVWLQGSACTDTLLVPPGSRGPIHCAPETLQVTTDRGYDARIFVRGLAGVHLTLTIPDEPLPYRICARTKARYSGWSCVSCILGGQPASVGGHPGDDARIPLGAKFYDVRGREVPKPLANAVTLWRAPDGRSGRVVVLR